MGPGGYLQWDEVDLGTFFPNAIIPTALKVAANDFVTKWRSEYTRSGILLRLMPLPFLFSDL